MNVSCAYYGGVGVATGLDGTCHRILGGDHWRMVCIVGYLHLVCSQIFVHKLLNATSGRGRIYEGSSHYKRVCWQ
jgi:hypothetical protein